MDMKLVFYTLPPAKVPWPYVLVNLNNYRKQLSYLFRFRRVIKGVMIDAGVEIFRSEKIKEYPGGPEARIVRAVRVYDTVRSILPGVDVRPVIPDYPDDYKHMALWISEKETNIERTFRNIILALDEFSDIPWIIPIQGHNKSPKSVLRSIKLLREAGIIEKADIFGVANLCVERRVDIMIKTLGIVRSELGPNKRIHAFGIKMEAIAEAWRTSPLFVGGRLLDSADSRAWTRPCGLASYYLALHGRKRASYKNQRDEAIYFLTWIFTLAEVRKIPVDGYSRKWLFDAMDRLMLRKELYPLLKEFIHIPRKSTLRMLAKEI